MLNQAIQIFSRPFRRLPRPNDISFETCFKGSCWEEGRQCKEIIQSSSESNLTDTLIFSSNGFVHAAATAVRFQHHLILRPDDYWFALIIQLSFHVNKHAQEIQERLFGDTHSGKPELEVVVSGSRYTFDHNILFAEMSCLLRDKVSRWPQLRAYIMPQWSTTTPKDDTTAAILMMAFLQKYFTFKFRYEHGVSSRLICKERDNDDRLSPKTLGQIKNIGHEPHDWYHLLLFPDDYFSLPDLSNELQEMSSLFYQIMIMRNGMLGNDVMRGWFTAFCLWNSEGELLYQPRPGEATGPGLGFSYGAIDMESVPRGYVTVPIKCNDNGYEFDAVVVAGSIGIKCISTVRPGIPETVQANSGWVMYEKRLEVNGV